ncbi:MAG: MFS transporter, partial [bacterium]|nr:MFS transporter [bacterium]
SMLRQFSLYGFLKNQRYFEPFLLLVFLDRGLDYFTIGLLISFRELAINLLEIPSGAMADLWGRRRAMILSFGAYITSFLIFGLARDLSMFFGAMLLFAVGEAFRTGTHKAMIFSWLQQQGRAGERTRVYGYTRSWSKYGSALSVTFAAVFVYLSDSYVYVFYLSVIPYLLGIINFLGYPADLDGNKPATHTPRELVAHLRAGFRQAFAVAGLRRLIVESMGFQGVYEATKDYLQPVLQAAAIAAAAHWSQTRGMSQIQQSTLLIGPLYLILHLLAGTASRQAHRVVEAAGDEDRAAHLLWLADGILFAGLAVAAFWRFEVAIIVAFVALDTLHNIWRPVQLGRFDTHGTEAQGATLLSIESQARRLTTVIAAPLLGLAVDAVRVSGTGGPFWPVGVLGLSVAMIFQLRNFHLRRFQPRR